MAIEDYLKSMKADEEFRNFLKDVNKRFDEGSISINQAIKELEEWKTSYIKSTSCEVEDAD